MLRPQLLLVLFVSENKLFNLHYSTLWKNYLFHIFKIRYFDVLFIKKMWIQISKPAAVVGAATEGGGGYSAILLIELVTSQSIHCRPNVLCLLCMKHVYPVSQVQIQPFFWFNSTDFSPFLFYQRQSFLLALTRTGKS